MRKSTWRSTIVAAGALMAIAVVGGSAVAYAPAGVAAVTLEDQVQQGLTPYYGVFDNLSFRVDNGTVILSGQVTQPAVKDKAERLVRNLVGVKFVKNEIETLPASSLDDQIRRNAYRAIYGGGALERYAVGSPASIHIIVKNGNIRLAGVVSNDADRTLAYVRVNAVPGVLSVTNDLRVLRTPTSV
jgi:osmotically-inducible protein OsmY